MVSKIQKAQSLVWCTVIQHEQKQQKQHHRSGAPYEPKLYPFYNSRPRPDALMMWWQKRKGRHSLDGCHASVSHKPWEFLQADIILIRLWFGLVVIHVSTKRRVIIRHQKAVRAVPLAAVGQLKSPRSYPTLAPPPFAACREPKGPPPPPHRQTASRGWCPSCHPCRRRR